MPPSGRSIAVDESGTQHFSAASIIPLRRTPSMLAISAFAMLNGSEAVMLVIQPTR